MSTVLAFTQPPIDEPAHEWATYMFTGIMVFFFVLAVGWSIRESRSGAGFLPLACVAGGALSFAFEPVLDAVAHIWYPLGSPLTIVTVFGTTIPGYVLLAYVFWVGVGSYLTMVWLSRGPSARTIFLAYLACVAIEPLFEYPAVLSTALMYYGDQPLELFGYPLYWAFPNSASVFVAGYALLLARPFLNGARGFVVAALIPALGFFTTCAATAWPVWLALNSEVPTALLYAAGLLTIALNIAVIRLVGWCAERGVSLEVAPDGLPREAREPKVTQSALRPAG